MVKESVGSKSGYSKRKENGRNLLVDFLMIIVVLCHWKMFTAKMTFK